MIRYLRAPYPFLSSFQIISNSKPITTNKVVDCMVVQGPQDTIFYYHLGSYPLSPYASFIICITFEIILTIIILIPMVFEAWFYTKVFVSISHDLPLLSRSLCFPVLRSFQASTILTSHPFQFPFFKIFSRDSGISHIRPQGLKNLNTHLKLTSKDLDSYDDEAYWVVCPLSLMRLKSKKIRLFQCLDLLYWMTNQVSSQLETRNFSKG